MKKPDERQYTVPSVRAQLKQFLALKLREWAQVLSPIKPNTVRPDNPPLEMYRDALSGRTATLQRLKLNKRFDPDEMQQKGKSYVDCKAEVQRDLIEELKRMQLDGLVLIEDYRHGPRYGYEICGTLFIYVWDE